MGNKKAEPRPSSLARLQAETARIMAPEARMPDRPKQVSTTISATGAAYARDPAHDQRVTGAILAGKSNQEVARIMADVAAEMAANPPPVVGPPGTYADEKPVPMKQRSQPLMASDRSQA